MASASTIKSSSAAIGQTDLFKEKPESSNMCSNHGNFQYLPGSSNYQESHSKSPKTSVKPTERKRKGRPRKKALDRATIHWSGLRMVAESAFDSNHGWISEMLEKAFLISLDKSGKSKLLPDAGMYEFFVKYSEQSDSIQQFLNLNDLTRGRWEQAMLLLAIQEDNPEAVKRLLSENHADPNFIDEHGHSALLYSSCAGSKDVMLQLLECGADVHFHDHLGRNALWYACKNQNLIAIDHLVGCEAVHPGSLDNEDINSNLVDTLIFKQSSDSVTFGNFLLAHRPRTEHNVSETTENSPPIQLTMDPDLISTLTHYDVTNSSSHSSQDALDSDSADKSVYSANNSFSDVIEDDVDNDDEEEEEGDDEYTDDDGSLSIDTLSLQGSSELSSVATSFTGTWTRKDSNQMVPTAIERWKQGIAQQVMAGVLELIGCGHGASSRTNSPESGKNSSNSIATSSPSSPSSSSRRRHRKARLNQGHLQKRRSSNENDDDEEDGDDGCRRPISLPLALVSPKRKKSRRFACPYYRRNPEKYNSDKRSCVRGLGWVTAHRLK